MGTHVDTPHKNFAEMVRKEEARDCPAPLLRDRVEIFRNLKRVYIEYDYVFSILAALDRLVDYGDLGPDVRGPAECLAIIGPSGSGKSALIDNWCSRFEDEVTPTGDRRPVLYVEVPSNCTIKSVAACLLDELHVPERLYRRATEVTLMKMVKHHLREQHVKVVILDEVNNLVDERSHRIVRHVADAIKSLLNANICPFVLAGIPVADAIFAQNEQLRRRVTARYEMRALKWEKLREQDLFRALLREYETHLPFAEPLGLEGKSLALGLHKLSNGHIGCAFGFLSSATQLALEQGDDRLSESVLWKTAEVMPEISKRDKLNPFGEIEPTEAPAADRASGPDPGG